MMLKCSVSDAHLLSTTRLILLEDQSDEALTGRSGCPIQARDQVICLAPIVECALQA